MRILTYNVHGCVGLDFQRSESRIAAEIARLAPDIIALQELDMGRKRSRGRDQAGLIAAHLNFQMHFSPAMRWKEEHYGNATLSRWTMNLRRAGALPSEHAFLFCETRSALWMEIATPQGLLQVVNTHLGVGRRERREQADALMGLEWLGAIAPDEPTLLLGDLNSLPGSPIHAIFERRLVDLVKTFPVPQQATFPVPFPLVRLDHIFGNGRIRTKRVEVPRGIWASDHLPVVLDFDICPHAASDSSFAPDCDATF